MPAAVAGVAVVALALAVVLAHVSGAEAAVRRTTLLVSWGWMNPDGYWRQVVVANGTIPGPTLRGVVGDELRVTVVNMLVGSTTTLHWHGLLLEHPQWDGAAMVTQYPIPPGQRYAAAPRRSHPASLEVVSSHET